MQFSRRDFLRSSGLALGAVALPGYPLAGGVLEKEKVIGAGFHQPRTILMTGLTRDGVWYIEQGQVRYPVRNFRFNQSLLELLAPGNVELIGRSERVGPSEGQGREAGLVPALKLKQFHFTSPSDAI